MTNPRKRGSAPDRARDAHLRPGSFKKGHRKLGGRKRGTPNAFSPDYKQAILEAAHRVGHDGNGEDGAVGYFILGRRTRPGFFLYRGLGRPAAARRGTDQRARAAAPDIGRTQPMVS